MEWISVDDRLPDDLRRVLICLKCPEPSGIYDCIAGYDFGWYSTGYGWYAGDYGAKDAQKSGRVRVTHWMPLPEPPNEQT